jgi:hypothetical protein
MLRNVCFLIRLSMEGNPEESEITAGGGPSEEPSGSAKKKN